MKVLIVEDDMLQRMLLADMLRRFATFARVEIVETIDGESAWKELEAGLCPALVCCDMRMPGMSGIELLQKFRTRTVLADVPFVFVTMATEREIVQEAIAAGATNYILKPFNLAKSRPTLERIFRGIREQYSEEPLATQKRLGVAPDKLVGYFEAFKQQLADAAPDLQRFLSTGESSPAQARLDTLRNGCVTLGLWHAASSIEFIHSLAPEMVTRVLGDVAQIADEQVARVRQEFGLREARKAKAEDGTGAGGDPAADASLPVASAA